MSIETFLPTSDENGGGVTTAVNAAVTDTSTELKVPGGPHLLIGAGPQALFFRFGKKGTGAVTTANGIYVGAGTSRVFSVPEGANTILHIRAVSTDSTISLQSGISGT